ncbi:N-formylglutamate amidohydrolase [Alkalicoccus urumqiensis]|uniref:N-formylglutamate amidohydrolase n=2 Tax=Alkalicoccus urumqiensis TaxID=1548213 RepID=A0A2P6MJB9_ALKUR|nr:N-formylglutamate amidohydrolase [Alkalicoccus urumqiensis]
MLLSVPHGGEVIPDPLKERLLLSPLETALDGDTWTRTLFDFSEEAAAFLSMETARIVIDLNRDPTDLPPENPDGVVKTKTVDGKSVWKKELTPEETTGLIEAFYEPYHTALMEMTQRPEVTIIVDCHSMLETGPSKKGPEWEKRPLFCISNGGHSDGTVPEEGITAPPDVMARFSALLEEVFSDYAVPDVPLVTVNDPFRGGYITRSHGRRTEKPWIQLEINRRLYLPEVPDVEPDAEDLARLEALRLKFLDVFDALSRPADLPVEDEKTIS